MIPIITLPLAQEMNFIKSTIPMLFNSEQSTWPWEKERELHHVHHREQLRV